MTDHDFAMTLLEEADRAEQIRNAFTGFTAPCPGNVQDINRAISELSGLAYILREVYDAVEAQTAPLHRDIKENLENVHDDVTFTLRDIWRSLGRMGKGRDVLTSRDFQRTWNEISTNRVGGKDLHERLERYRRFLDLLTRILKQQYDRISEYDDLGREMPQVRALQNRGRKLLKNLAPIETGMENLAIEKPTTKKRSYERQRPLSPTESSASSKTDGFKYDGPVAPTPPMSPRQTQLPSDPPLSPTQTFSSLNSHVSSIPSAGSDSTHWATQVFKNVSSTPLPWNSEETRHHEQPGHVECDLPSSRYEPVLTLMYPEGVRVKLFCQPTTSRAKIVTYYRDYRGRNDYACQPLETLHLRREGSLLRICGKRKSGRPIPWTTLKFTTIERLVLFAGTFLAMRSQDPRSGNLDVMDDELHDEVTEFAGVIIDSEYKHALRIYHDRITNAVRLQASVLGGELDRSPVWMAFVTHALMSPAWCSQQNKRTVALGEIRQHIFTSQYQPQYAPNGSFILRFEIESDATQFMDIINHIRLERLK